MAADLAPASRREREFHQAFASGVLGVGGFMGGVKVDVQKVLPDDTVYITKRGDQRVPDDVSLACNPTTFRALVDDITYLDLCKVYELRPDAHGQYPFTQPAMPYEPNLVKPMEPWENSLAAAGRLDAAALREVRKDSVHAASIGGWELYLASGGHLEHMQCYVDQATECAYISHETYETLGHSEAALETFYEDMTKGSGMKRLVTDAGKYREAALAEAAAKGLDKPAPGRDLLDSLMAEANALLTQAGGLNTKPTPLQLQIFAERLGELYDGIAQAAAKVEQLRSLADLAALAVADSTE